MVPRPESFRMMARWVTLLLALCLTTVAADEEADPSRIDLSTNPAPVESDSSFLTITGSVVTADEQSGIIRRLQSEEMIERVTRLSLPFVKDPDEVDPVVTGDEEPMLKSLTFQASHLAALRHWRGGGGDGRALPLDITTQMEWDPETESYSLSNVRLELLGEHLWLDRDWREDTDETWNMGIQFKRTW